MKFKEKRLEKFRETDYLVSTHGEVINGKTGLERKPQQKSNGYRSVMLWQHGKYKTFYIHRIVAECFLPADEKKIFVNHKDGNKSNNNLSNLEWCTRSENAKHAFETGLQSPTRLKGWDNGNYKGPIVGMNIKTGEEVIMRSLPDVVNYGFTSSGVGKVLMGTYKQHKGYVFKRHPNSSKPNADID